MLIYSLGNELNYVNNSNRDTYKQILDIVGRLMNYARDYQRTTWEYVRARLPCTAFVPNAANVLSSRLIPFATGTDDNNADFDWLAGLMPVDIFMPNAGYRSTASINSFGFFNLWSGAHTLSTCV